MEDFCKDHNCVVLYGCDLDGCDMKDVDATCSQHFNRKQTPDLEYLIEENWNKFSKEIEILYNGEKFRINSVNKSRRCVNIEVGLTCYKDYIGTNLSSNIDEFIEYGLKNHRSKQSCLSDALGVGAIVITADNFLLFVTRSHGVAEAKGIQFQNRRGKKEMAKKIGIEKIDLEKLDGKDVIYEIFHSMVREVRDEINIPESSLSWPLLLGFIRNIANGGKPHASFLITCDLTKNQIEQLYRKGGPEAYESTEIFFIKKQELVNLSAEQLRERLGDLTPCGKATLYLYFNSFKSSCSQ